MNNKDDLATKAGRFIGIVLVGCVTAVLVGLTVKLLLWMF